jgi:hypothetical protein
MFSPCLYHYWLASDHSAVPCSSQREGSYVSASEGTVLLRLLIDHTTVFRDQEISIRELLDLHRHYGPLHKHATTGIPREPGLEEVHGPSPSCLSHCLSPCSRSSFRSGLH